MLHCCKTSGFVGMLVSTPIAFASGHLCSPRRIFKAPALQDVKAGHGQRESIVAISDGLVRCVREQQQAADEPRTGQLTSKLERSPGDDRPEVLQQNLETPRTHWQSAPYSIRPSSIIRKGGLESHHTRGRSFWV
eukprot:1474899-Amphidinium_carterae.1